MARFIESPGVQVNEIDLSVYQNPPAGTTILAAGFAAQGPTEEAVAISHISEFEELFGTPTTAAERYLYHTAKQVLKSPANLVVSRLPYGSGDGVGYGNEFGALVYPMGFAETSAYDPIVTGYRLSSTTSTILGPNDFNLALNTVSSLPGVSSYTNEYLDEGFDNLNEIYPFNSSIIVGDSTTTGSAITVEAYNLLNAIESTSGALLSTFTLSSLTVETISAVNPDSFYIGEPVHLTLNQYQYEQLQCGGFNWSDITSLALDNEGIDFSTIGTAGMILVNESRTTVDDQYAGYYLTITDNSGISPTTDFDSVTGIKAILDNTQTYQWTDVPSARIGFDLSALYNGAKGSISEIIENIPGYDFGADEYRDSLIVSLWKVRNTNFSQSSVALDAVLVEKFVGSVNAKRKEFSKFDTVKQTFFLENLINTQSRHIKAYINPNISNLCDWFGDDGKPSRSVRVMRAASEPDNANAVTALKYADNLYGIGTFTPGVAPTEGFCANSTDTCPKNVGNVPAKLARVLSFLENPDILDIDVTVEAGLGTIWTTVKADSNSWCTGDPNDQSYVFDDTVVLNVEEALAYNPETGGGYTPAGGLQDHYESINSIFTNFAEFTMKRNGGVGHLHIADPLRQIFVNGRDCKTITPAGIGQGKTFSRNIYWPLRNLFQATNSSYVATYGNWAKVYDTTSDKYVWLPMSGWAASKFAQVDSTSYPWTAAFGLENGILTDIVDIAVNPNQKERDWLYQIGVNPVVLFPRDGYCLWGQKTLQKKPSAFDRINVRRLFLWLEKATLNTLKYFVSKPNTIFTRTRLKNTITPAFNTAKNNEGVYDYLIVCDTRNNTPDKIDRNELCVDIYIKPTKTAEFILANFIATRTGQDFKEIS